MDGWRRLRADVGGDAQCTRRRTAELAGEDQKRAPGHGFVRGLILCEEEETTKLAKGLGGNSGDV
jgi:hypothetical protein